MPESYFRFRAWNPCSAALRYRATSARAGMTGLAGLKWEPFSADVLPDVDCFNHGSASLPLHDVDTNNDFNIPVSPI